MSKFLTGCIFVCLGVLIYSNSFHGSFHLDDIPSIVENPAVCGIGGIGSIWSFWPTRFLTYLSFAANFYFHGLSVWGYHLINLIIHISCAVLVWRITAFTLSLPSIKDENIRKNSGFIAVLSGLIFLTHPLQTQAVTYIVQRSASMTGLFYLGTVYLYGKAWGIRYGDTRGSERNLAISNILYAGSLLTAVLAMFTKEIAITLPFAVLLYHVCFLSGARRGYRLLAPFFLLLAIIPLTMLFTRSIDFMHMGRVTEDRVNILPLHYLFTQFRVVMTYIRILFIPLGQNLDYDYRVSVSFFEPSVIAGFLAIIFIISAGILLFQKRRLVAFGIFWFFLTLLPESSVIPINDVIFEHRLYIPVFGFSIFLAGAMSYISGGKKHIVSAGMLAGLILLYSFLAHNRNFVWKDEISLWSDVISKSPEKGRGYVNRGMAYQMKGETDNAILDYHNAIRIDPSHAGTYSNLGMIYMGRGNIDSGIMYFDKALEIQPDLAGVWYNRGCAYELKGNLAEALNNYNKAIEINPVYEDAYNNRGNVYLKMGDRIRSVADYRKAIEINPKYAPARYNLEKFFGEKEADLTE